MEELPPAEEYDISAEQAGQLERLAARLGFDRRPPESSQSAGDYSWESSGAGSRGRASAAPVIGNTEIAPQPESSDAAGGRTSAASGAEPVSAAAAARGQAAEAPGAEAAAAAAEYGFMSVLPVQEAPLFSDASSSNSSSAHSSPKKPATASQKAYRVAVRQGEQAAEARPPPSSLVTDSEAAGSQPAAAPSPQPPQLPVDLVNTNGGPQTEAAAPPISSLATESNEAASHGDSLEEADRAPVSTIPIASDEAQPTTAATLQEADHAEANASETTTMAAAVATVATLQEARQATGSATVTLPAVPQSQPPNDGGKHPFGNQKATEVEDFEAAVHSHLRALLRATAVLTMDEEEPEPASTLGVSATDAGGEELAPSSAVSQSSPAKSKASLPSPKPTTPAEHPETTPAPPPPRTPAAPRQLTPATTTQTTAIAASDIADSNPARLRTRQQSDEAPRSDPNLASAPATQGSASRTNRSSPTGYEGDASQAAGLDPHGQIRPEMKHKRLRKRRHPGQRDAHDVPAKRPAPTGVGDDDDRQSQASDDSASRAFLAQLAVYRRQSSASLRTERESQSQAQEGQAAAEDKPTDAAEDVGSGQRAHTGAAVPTAAQPGIDALEGQKVLQDGGTGLASSSMMSGESEQLDASDDESGSDYVTATRTPPLSEAQLSEVATRVMRAPPADGISFHDPEDSLATIRNFWSIIGGKSSAVR